MSFLTALALGVALLVAAPYLAHRLRRRRAQELPFPPARLVARAPEKVRQRSRLEDRALLVTRAVAILGLAVLGATPFVSCSKLSLQRSGGASVAMALVVDDSMSMRASAAPGAGADSAGSDLKSRFARARQGARELLASAREGDAVALVLAGGPARIALAATTDLNAARDAIAALVPTDRGTDLDGAVALARGLVASLPQVDRRVVVLSDLADGHSDGPALTGTSDLPIWIALPELRRDDTDCAVLQADRRGARVHAVVACGPGKSAAGRQLVIEDAAGNALARAPVEGGATADVSVLLPSDTAEPASARLTGQDAIASDDVAPVVPEAGRGTIAVVADAAEEAVATGGAPIVEQALASLKIDADVRPLPAMPDRVEDLGGSVGLVLDDPPGFTPEQRHALGAYLERGGIVLLALGPRAAQAPLGATFEPVLGRPLAWADTPSPGVDLASTVDGLAESSESLTQLGARRRAVLAAEDAAAFTPVARWSDGPPLIARRTIGRGEVWLVTLPFSVDASDLTLRPAFLALLDTWAGEARRRAAPARSDVGTTWKFFGARTVEATGPGGETTVSRDDGTPAFSSSLLGAYSITVDGQRETRVTAPVETELDLRPRPAVADTTGASAGGRRSAVDVSAEVALALLALMLVEMVLRLRAFSRRGFAPEG